MVKAGNWRTRLYLSIMFRVTGRAIQAAGRRDPELREIFAALPPGFSFRLSVWPDGPELNIETDSSTLPRYGGSKGASDPSLHMEITSPAHAMALFTFAESTTMSAARGRLVTRGDLSHACTMVRVLDRVETYLLPRPIARQAVKRYESPQKKHRMRLAVWLGIIFSRGGSRS